MATTRTEHPPAAPGAGPHASAARRGVPGLGAGPSRRPRRILDDGIDLDRRLVLLTVALRWTTVGLALVFGLGRGSLGWEFVLCGLALTAWALLQTLRPPRLDPPDRAARLTVAAELCLAVGAAMLTGVLESPFALTAMVPLILAGYVWGERQLLAPVAVAALGIGAALLFQRADPDSQRSSAVLGILFLLSGLLGSFTRRLVGELKDRQAEAVDQVNRMATANELLVALHGLAQTLPTSLDLGEVIDSTRVRLRSLFDSTAVVVLVRDEASDEWRVELAEGCRLPQLIGSDALPAPLARALLHVRPLSIADLGGDGGGCASSSRSGVYAALRARGNVVALVGVEHRGPDSYGPRDVDLLANVAGPVALAIDNARWFARLRRFGAEAERARIARDIHDRLAQSLAYIAFELERLSDSAPTPERGQDLDGLREVVRDVVGDLRETLYQLRASVTGERDLESVAGEYLERWSERTGVIVEWEHRIERRLPFQVEQELWRILQETLVNVERHAGATRLQVRWRVADGVALLEVRDDGRGFRPHADHGDHYGLLGMHERAEAVGAHLTVDSEPGAGARVLVELEVPR